MIETDSANKTAYFSVARYQGKDYWVESEQPCEHELIDLCGEHIYCPACTGIAYAEAVGC